MSNLLLPPLLVLTDAETHAAARPHPIPAISSQFKEKHKEIYLKKQCQLPGGSNLFHCPVGCNNNASNIAQSVLASV